MQTPILKLVIYEVFQKDSEQPVGIEQHQPTLVETLDPTIESPIISNRNQSNISNLLPVIMRPWQETNRPYSLVTYLAIGAIKVLIQIATFMNS